MVQSFQELVVWQRAMDLGVAVYELTRGFPQQEVYGLTSQLRRAAVSVASNIAEGRGRLTEGEFRNFLSQAQGSNCELQTQLILARRLGLGQETLLVRSEEMSLEVAKMLSSLIASLTAKS